MSMQSPTRFGASGKSGASQRALASSLPEDLRIPLGTTHLRGSVGGAPTAKGAVLLIHGSGVQLDDRRDCLIATQLRQAGLLTLGIDLLDEVERLDRHNVFDVEFQAQRLLEVNVWLARHLEGVDVPIGYFASGIGASIVLEAAALDPSRASAIVVRGGRPDVAQFWLPKVTAPTLFIVDGTEGATAKQARASCDRLTGENQIVVVGSPSHSFSEPSVMQAVAREAETWFLRHLVAQPERPAS